VVRSSTHNQERHSQKCHILLVEDNKINQKVVTLMLGKYGIQPAIAEGGQEAINKAVGEPYDLILMDLHMPGMDGMEAASRIKSQLGDKSPPIVALTADAMRCESLSYREHGLDGCLTKPINSDILKSCIEQFTSYRF
jgi:CheY-like chemotaxis protein